MTISWLGWERWVMEHHEDVYTVLSGRKSIQYGGFMVKEFLGKIMKYLKSSEDLCRALGDP